MSKKPFSIDEYIAKRDFAKTPEPAPQTKKAGRRERVFVVQRHEASQLHYDLRLEMGGVLKSFAVPRGFSYVPQDKHLAVRTEDHPLEYFDFEGVIPPGEYGAGTMVIYDRGIYRFAGDEDGLANGELKIILYGGRLRGEWHLVKTRRAEKDWLLFKSRDRYARGEDDPVFPLDFSRTDPEPFPKRLRLMTVARDVEIFDDLAWAYELEFSGLRMLAGVQGGESRYWDGGGKRMRSSLASLDESLLSVRAESVLLDGVLVAPDETGRPDRDRLDQRLASGDTDSLVYYAFDLLFYEEWGLQNQTLVDRKRGLASLLPAQDNLLYVDHVTGRGSDVLAAVERGELAGVIAKRAASPYATGASEDWLRIPARGSKRKQDKDVFAALQTEGGPQAHSDRVKLSNRNKVYWPEQGITKGQLLDYYDQVAEVLLPYLAERPIHMLRYPDGIQGKYFYHKKVPDHTPDWVDRTQVTVKDGEPIYYIVCSDRDTLLYLVNLGSIDLHPWFSRRGNLESPDWAILDLDPSVDDFSKVIRIAQSIGRRLRGAGMRPLLKTSGASGLHIYIPLAPGYTYEQSRMFCELVARMTVQELGDIATVERSVAQRESKVYIDFLQNIREQTIVPPYVVRPVPGAQVSAPLEWDELRSSLRPSQFTMFNLGERLARLGDLFRPALDDPQELLPALEKIQLERDR